LAAFYVVLDHHITDMGSKLPAGLQHATFWMGFGHYAVDVFIVLSGYCLMLPIDRGGGGRMPGGVLEYFRRRALRILPPYFAALLLSLLVIWAMHRPDHVTVGDLVTHLLVVHNFSSQWIWSINPPLWSVAVEWQIYFAFPLLLLPAWRRLGAAGCVGLGFCLGMLPHFLMAPGHNFDWSFPWYLGLFGMGMAAVVESHRKLGHRQDAWYRRLCLWAAAAAFVIVAFSTWRGNSLYQHNYVMDVLMGLATAAALTWCGRHSLDQHAANPLLLRLICSRPLAMLGAMSFSLYLIHVPVWWMLEPAVSRLAPTPLRELAFRFLVGVPVALLISYVFYRCVERPCMVRRNRASRPPRKAPPTSAKAIVQADAPAIA
jgi:peptidoglycan/LPS O-acetylase OafA/YrhL